MLSHVSKYAKCLKETTKKQDEVSGKIITIIGRLILKCLQNKIICTSKRNRMESYITKYKKLNILITCSSSITPDYNIFIISFSTIHLNEKELKQLQKELDYSFVDKNKYVKKEYCMKLGKSCRSSGQGS